MTDIEKVKDQAERFGPKVEEAKGQVRETVAHVKDSVYRQAKEAQTTAAEAAREVDTAITSVDRTTLAVVAAAGAVLLGVVGAIIRGRLVAGESSSLQRRGQAAIDLGRTQAMKTKATAEKSAKATAQQWGNKLADQLDLVSDQIRSQQKGRRASSLPGVIAGLAILAVIIAVVSSPASRRLNT